MNKDIRISVDFFQHHKTKRLRRRLGWEGVIALQQLWCYAAKHKPEGSLAGMDSEDIADVCDWEGKPEEFVSQLCEIGFLDQCDEGIYHLHDWEENNPWAAKAKERSEKARKAAQARYQRREQCYEYAEGMPNACEEHATGKSEHAASTAPSPSPSPPPDGNTEYSSSDEEERSTSSDEEPAATATAPATSSNGVPAQKILSLWNEEVQSSESPMPRVQRIKQGTQRYKHVRARWKENPDLELWKTVIAKAARSSFLNGRIKAWQADFDWIIKSPDNFTKVLEGKYDDREEPAYADAGPAPF